MPLLAQTPRNFAAPAPLAAGGGPALKIALVGDWFLPRVGGIEWQMRDLALALLARGHRVEVIAAVPGPESVDGIAVRRLPGARLPGFGIAFTPAPFAALRRHILAGGYDVIHVQAGNVAPVAHHALQFAARRGLPAVATFHSVLRYYDIPLKLLDRLHGYSRWPVRFTAVSTVAAEALRPLVGDRAPAVIPNGTDLGWWSRESPRQERPGPVEIVSVTRLQKRKRARWLIKAFARAVEGLAEDAARLTIVGDGDERPALERLVRRLGLAGRVILTGRLPRQDVRAALHRSDVFALASTLEAFGIAALEARAAGLPVVTMRASGARDFLRHGEDALLAEDDAALAAHLRQAISDAGLRRRLQAAAAAPPAGLDWQDVAPRYEAEYRAAIAAVRRSAA